MDRKVDSTDRGGGASRGRAVRWISAFALSLLWGWSPATALAQECGDTIPSCPPNSTCARGRAVTFELDTVIDIRTGDTQCQTFPPDRTEFGPGTPFLPLSPLVNVIANDSQTRARTVGQRFVQSTAGEATVEVLPSIIPGVAPLLTAVTTGSQATICGDAVSGDSGITLLELNGENILPLLEDIEPNTEILPEDILSPLKLIVLNEQIEETPIVNGNCVTRRFTVNALRVRVLNLLELVDIIISGSYVESTTCGTPPVIEPTDFGAIYGGKPGDAALLPYFIVGPAGTVSARDTHVTIVHDDLDNNEFLHWTIYNIDSQEECNACVPWTGEDVFVERMSRLVSQGCGAVAQDNLDAGNGVKGDGIFVGYATFEPSTRSDCAAIAPENDLIAHFYQTNLQVGLASGFNGPVYSTPALGERSFEEFGLVEGDPLYFRLLVGLDGVDTAADTNLVIWSDSSGACGNFKDSDCLRGTAQDGTLRVCDESENCSSQARPSLNKEVNIIAADAIVPAVFATDGGWVSLVSNPTSGGQLNVLGYSDNQANGLNATLNFQSIFPAQRTQIPLQCR